MRKNVTDMEFANIRELVEIGTQVGLILESEKEAIALYIELMYRNGCFVDVTDLKISEDGDLRVPLTLKALIGLLKQRDLDISTARMKYKKYQKEEVVFDKEKLFLAMDKISRQLNISKNDLNDAIIKQDFSGLCKKNDEVKHAIPILKSCITHNARQWYKSSADSIGMKPTELTKHPAKWVDAIKSKLE